MNILYWEEELKDLPHLPIRGGELRFNCKFCNDTKYHLYVNLSKKLFHCFKCERSGRIMSRKGESQLLEEGDYRKYYRLYETKIEPTSKLTSIVKSLPRSNPIIDIYRVIYNEGCKSYHEYLSSRGISHDEMIKYRFRYSLDREGIYSNSIIVPIGEIEDPDYFVCRKIDNSEPKYVNAPWPKGANVFAAIAEREVGTCEGIRPWFICEGIFDAIAICRAGYTAYAILGKRLTCEQVEYLKEFYPNPYIMLDPDAFPYGVKMALELGGKLIDMEKYDKDPGDMTPEEIKGVINANLPFGR